MSRRVLGRPESALVRQPCHRPRSGCDRFECENIVAPQKRLKPTAGSVQHRACRSRHGWPDRPGDRAARRTARDDRERGCRERGIPSGEVDTARIESLRNAVAASGATDAGGEGAVAALPVASSVSVSSEPPSTTSASVPVIPRRLWRGGVHRSRTAHRRRATRCR
jgi:hypothetical protein